MIFKLVKHFNVKSHPLEFKLLVPKLIDFSGWSLNVLIQGTQYQ